MSAEVFEQHRNRLTRIAYGMLGSVMEAEDIVQDAYLRWSELDVSKIEAPAAYLTTITTRLAIDRLRSAQVRREHYVGPWLPDPIVTSFAPDPAEIVTEGESLSMAVMTALEKLNPTERAVLLLRDVFDFDYPDIADVVAKSPANCRQIASRARDKAGSLSPASSRAAWETDIINRYITAVTDGDVDGLARIFAEDVVLWSDGGGVARAARHPLHGAVRVARHLVGVSPQTPEGTEVRLVRVNGEPALMGVLDGKAIGIVIFEIREGLVTAVRASLNPDKLAHITTSDQATPSGT